MTRRHDSCSRLPAHDCTVLRLLRRASLLSLASLPWLASTACQPSSEAPPTAASPAAPLAVPSAQGVPASQSAAAQSAVPATGSPLALPAVERARLSYALDSTNLVAQDWPWLRSDETCVLLIAPHVQWIVNCLEAPDEFAAVGEPLLGRPVYARDSDTIEAGGQSVPSTAFIGAVPATADVPVPGSATKGLTGETPWIIASTLDGLIGTHPAFGKGTPTEEWLGVFLHEFFHTRQFMLPSFRSALVALKTGKVDSVALEKLFKEDASYRALVEREYAVLSAAAARDAALTVGAAREALQSWSSLYAERRARLHKLGGDAFVRADAMLTYAEGTARYVEAMFLSDARFHSSLPLESDPHYESFRRSSAKPGYQGLALRELGPRYVYALGMHLALVLDRADPTWKKRVSEEPEWIVSLARAAAASAPATGRAP
ncbi:MAG: hypothetical protein ABW217_01575 [Polyangiaceae bacterium]